MSLLAISVAQFLLTYLHLSRLPLLCSCQSPNPTFSFENGKYILISLGPNPILICKSDLQYSSPTTRPIVDVNNSTVSLMFQGSGCGLAKIFIFLSPAVSLCNLKWVLGMVRKWEHSFQLEQCCPRNADNSVSFTARQYCPLRKVDNFRWEQ